VDDDGVGVVVFDRPPVNAVSIAVYEALADLVDLVESSDEVRVLVLAAPPDARAWCGGADLNDFVGMDSAARKERYDFINRSLPRLYHLDRPVIAAVDGHAVGIGVILAAMCDMRVAWEDASFSCPEIDFGLIAGGGGLLAWLKLPEGKVREMLYTGRRFSAAELRESGFFNYVVRREDVLPTSLELARLVAAKSLPAIKARKAVSNALEGLTWMDAYLLAQRATAELTDGRDAQEGVRAFLEHRDARLADA
jgi:enoyl-CoA hydratase